MSEVRIATIPTVAILEATVRNPSRNVIGFSMDDSKFAAGTVPLSWKILEHNDGAVVQVIYAGSVDVDIKLEGTVEGQRGDPSRFVSKDKLSSILTLFNFLTYSAAAIIILRKPKWWRILLSVIPVAVAAWSLWRFVNLLMQPSGMFSSPYGSF